METLEEVGMSKLGVANPEMGENDVLVSGVPF